MGGVLAIWGKDFAADNFNQFDPMLGNKVCLIQCQFGCGILKMVGPKMQAFWPRINMPPTKNL